MFLCIYLNHTAFSIDIVPTEKQLELDIALFKVLERYLQLFDFTRGGPLVSIVIRA